jgi:hypothetical protein
MKKWIWAGCMLLCSFAARAQDADNKSTDPDSKSTSAGYVPVITGGLGYVYNVVGGVPSLEPQIDPLLLVPFGSHVLLESRTDFTGFFQRRDGTGDYTGPIFKNVVYAQLDWLANSRITVVGGKYLLPFGLFTERYSPLWILTFQDRPIPGGIGTEDSGSGEGGELRGVAAQTGKMTINYTAYFSAHTNTNQLQASRLAGGDTSVFLPNQHLEVGGSYQRTLEGHQINSGALYAQWTPQVIPLDVRWEYDRNFNGQGYYIEGDYMLSQSPVAANFFKNMQLGLRAQQFDPLNGGGNGVPRVNTERVDIALNYYFRDNNWRVISNYGRQFSSGNDNNVWNVGFTYRFLWPLWPGRK